ncbi:helix-turn-helix domain-containing protein [Xanthobacter sp. KR7-65]|uniref:helix-turn-helix domain-containing protein n=1 Tax=Xanthobacter sp. KR7-65 TaxID=3156612 RepID=UPI0032B355C5
MAASTNTGFATTEAGNSKSSDPGFGALGIRDAATYLGIGETKLKEEIREKRLEARKFGTRTLILREALDAWRLRLPVRAA